ncbi:MAG: hypothetical protein HYY25_17170 [Candidatus Wallbacteria bacterium]|nr:hypothetical protein [Candidatus Wallbacteria bacterium]
MSFNAGSSVHFAQAALARTGLVLALLLASAWPAFAGGDHASTQGDIQSPRDSITLDGSALAGSLESSSDVDFLRFAGSASSTGYQLHFATGSTGMTGVLVNALGNEDPLTRFTPSPTFSGSSILMTGGAGDFDLQISGTVSGSYSILVISFNPAISPPSVTVTKNPPGTDDTISGTATANATIRVYSDFGRTTQLASGTAGSNGAFGPISIGDNANSQVFVTETNSGKQGPNAVANNDIVTPAPPSVTVTSNNAGTADTASGTSEASASIRVYTSSDKTSLIVNGSADSSGNWGPLSIGDNANAVIFVTASDAAGNESSGITATNSIPTPSAPTVTVTQNFPGMADTVSGTADANATIRVYTNSTKATLIVQGTANFLGAYGPLSIGDNTNDAVFVTATAGIEGPGTAGVNDIVAPLTPTASVTANAPGTADTVSGTAEPNINVGVFSSASGGNSNFIVSGTVDGSGNYGPLSIGDNAHPIVFVFAFDAANNSSPPVSAANISGSPPPAPTATVAQNAPGTADTVSGTAEISSTIKVYTAADKATLIVQGTATSLGAYGPLAIGDNSNSSIFVTATNSVGEGDGTTATNDTVAPLTPTVSVTQNTPGTADTAGGTAEANATVKLYPSAAKGSVIVQGSATAGGAYGPLSIGDNTNGTVFATATDAAGNEGPGASAANDIVPPSAPGVTVTQNSGGTADTVSGTVEAGSTVKVYTSSAKSSLIAQGSATGGGTYGPLSIGDNTNATLFVTATDAVGNESSGTSASNDISVPSAPTVSVAQNTPGTADTVSGTAQANATVKVYTSSAKTSVIVQGTATSGGAYGPLSIGDNTNATVFVTVTDARGEGPGSPATNDITAPAAPSATIAQNSPGTADSVSGASEAGASISVFTSSSKSTLIVQGTAANDGSYGPLSIGDNANATVFVTATDAAGNGSGGTSRTNDITAPLTPTVSVTQKNPGTNDTVGGTAEAAATVKVYASSAKTNLIVQGTATGSGTYGPLSIGDNANGTAFVSATDAAGNEGPGATAANDIVPPEAPAVTVTQRAPGIQDTVSGTAEAGAGIKVYTSAARTNLIVSGTVNSSGAWGPLSIGDNANLFVFVTASDTAGNESTGISATNPPVAPVVRVKQSAPGAADTVSGSVAGGAGLTIRVYSNPSKTTLIVSGTALSDGSWGPFSIGDNANGTVFVTAAAGSVEGPGTAATNDIIAPEPSAITLTQSPPGTADSIRGTAEAGATVRFFTSSNQASPFATRAVSSAGDWGPLAIGDNTNATVVVVVRDAALNESSGVTVTNDILVPAAPTLSVTQSPPTTDDLVSGTGEPGATLRLFTDFQRTTLLTTAEIGSAGNWGPVNLGNNQRSVIFATVRDTALNESGAVSATNDIVAPDAPILNVTSRALGTDDELSGSAERGALIRIFSSATRLGSIGTVTADAQDGLFGLSIGDNVNPTVFVTATDAAGNESQGSTAANVFPGAQLEYLAVQLGQATVVTGQAGVEVRATIRNIGGTAALLTASGLEFRTASDNTNVSSDYTVTAAPGPLTRLSAGASTVLTYFVAVSPAATLERVFVVATASGMDEILGGAVAARSDGSTSSWTVELRMALLFSRLEAKRRLMFRGSTRSVKFTLGAEPSTIRSERLKQVSATLRFPGDQFVVTKLRSGNRNFFVGLGEYEFRVEVGPNAPLGVVTATIEVSGIDSNSNLPIPVVGGSTRTFEYTVLEPDLVADAGDNQVVPARRSYVLDASRTQASRANPSPTYTWRYKGQVISRSPRVGIDPFLRNLAAVSTFRGATGAVVRENIITDVVYGTKAYDLEVTDGELSSRSSVQVEVRNNAPTATPRGPATFGPSALLDGSGSPDPDEDPLTYRWRVVSPVLSAPTTATFLPRPDLPETRLRTNVEGPVRVSLVVSDGTTESAPAFLDLVSEPTNPRALWFLSPRDGEVVTKDERLGTPGLQRVVKLLGADPALLVETNRTYPEVVVKVNGSEQYRGFFTSLRSKGNFLTDTERELELTLRRGGENVLEALTTLGGRTSTHRVAVDVPAIGDLPAPEIRIDLPTGGPRFVEFDGSRSRDGAGQAVVSYSWSIERGALSFAPFIPGAGKITYTLTSVGEYLFRLTTVDARGNEATASVTATVFDVPPSAFVTTFRQLLSDQTPLFGDRRGFLFQPAGVASVHPEAVTSVGLSARNSSDPNGDPITYRWRIIGAPDRSAADAASTTAVSLTTATEPETRLNFSQAVRQVKGMVVPVCLGETKVLLSISDGVNETTRAFSIFMTDPLNGIPTADPGPEQSITILRDQNDRLLPSVRDLVLPPSSPLSTSLRLDGRNSSDRSGRPLTYEWSLHEVRTTLNFRGEEVITRFEEVIHPGALKGPTPSFPLSILGERRTYEIDLRVRNDLDLVSLTKTVKLIPRFKRLSVPDPPPPPVARIEAQDLTNGQRTFPAMRSLETRIGRKILLDGSLAVGTFRNWTQTAGQRVELQPTNPQLSDNFPKMTFTPQKVDALRFRLITRNAEGAVDSAEIAVNVRDSAPPGLSVAARASGTTDVGLDLIDDLPTGPSRSLSVNLPTTVTLTATVTPNAAHVGHPYRVEWEQLDGPSATLSRQADPVVTGGATLTSVTQFSPTTSRVYVFSASATRLDTATLEPAEPPFSRAIRVAVSAAGVALPQPRPSISPTSIRPGSDEFRSGSITLNGSASIFAADRPDLTYAYRWSYIGDADIEIENPYALVTTAKLREEIFGTSSAGKTERGAQYDNQDCTSGSGSGSGLTKTGYFQLTIDVAPPGDLSEPGNASFKIEGIDPAAIPVDATGVRIFLNGLPISESTTAGVLTQFAQVAIPADATNGSTLTVQAVDFEGAPLEPQLVLRTNVLEFSDSAPSPLVSSGNGPLLVSSSARGRISSATVSQDLATLLSAQTLSSSGGRGGCALGKSTDPGLVSGLLLSLAPVLYLLALRFRLGRRA